MQRQGPGGDVWDSAGGAGEDFAAAGAQQVADLAAGDQRGIRAGARPADDLGAGSDPGDRGAAVHYVVQLVHQGLQSAYEVHGAGTIAKGEPHHRRSSGTVDRVGIARGYGRFRRPAFANRWRMWSILDGERTGKDRSFWRKLWQVTGQ